MTELLSSVPRIGRSNVTLFTTAKKKNRFTRSKYYCMHVKLLHTLSFPWNVKPCHELLTQKSPSGRYSSHVARCCSYSLCFSSRVYQKLNAVCCHPKTMQFYYDSISLKTSRRRRLLLTRHVILTLN